MKWVLGILGLLIKGVPGAIVGFLIGAFIDSMFSSKPTARQRQASQASSTNQNIFIQNLITLTAVVMKADGIATKAELDYVKRSFLNSFGERVTQDSLLQLRNILQQTPTYHVSAAQMLGYTTYTTRKQVVEFLLGITTVNGSISSQGEQLVRGISRTMGISLADYESIYEAVRNMFSRGGTSKTIRQADSAYTLLGIDKNISDSELKTAYRNLAKKYHPDMFASMGNEAQQKANKKFQEINEAYELIREERGL